MNKSLLVIALIALPLLGCDVRKTVLREKCCCTDGTEQNSRWSTEEKCTGTNELCVYSTSSGGQELYKLCKAPYPGDSSLQRPSTPPSHTLSRPEIRLALYVVDDSTSATSCLALCPPGAINANCTSGTLAATTTASLSALNARLNPDTPPLLNNIELLGLFGMQADPCGRGPSAVNERGIINVGGKCTLEVPFNNLGVKASFDVPILLAGTWSARTPVAKRLTFDAEEFAPRLTFMKTSASERHPLDADFGGPIRWIEADSSRVFARTNGGCIGVTYATQ
jgi:hypothetical protein